MRRAAGFTLLETIIAMGVLAVGATTALALLVSATATGRHAEHLVNSALIADNAFADAEADLNGSFGPKKLARLDPVESPAARPAGDSRAAPPYDPNFQQAAKGAPPVATPPTKKTGKTGPTVPANADDPFTAARSYWWKKDAQVTAFPDYKYDVAITPIGGPPDDPWEFLVEVTVRWTEQGQKRDGLYQSILLKRLTHLDNEAPPN